MTIVAGYSADTESEHEVLLEFVPDDSAESLARDAAALRIGVSRCRRWPDDGPARAGQSAWIPTPRSNPRRSTMIVPVRTTPSIR